MLLKNKFLHNFNYVVMSEICQIKIEVYLVLYNLNLHYGYKCNGIYVNFYFTIM